MYEKSFRLSPQSPFQLALTVWVLRRIPNNQVDQWDGKTYSRVLLVHGQPVRVTMTQKGSANAPVLYCSIGSSEEIATADVKSAISDMFGLSIDLSDFYDMARRDEQLAELTEPFVGMRPTRFHSLFEALLNAIACQQISLQAGLPVLNRLSHAYGKKLDEQNAFPTPEDLAQVDAADIKKSGLTMRKAQTVSVIARAIASGDINIENLKRLPDEEVISKLTSFTGIGRWTAEYVLLRGMGRLHSFPGDDVAGAGKLQKWLSLKTRPTYTDIRRLLDRWHPYEGLIYFHLLLRGIRERGNI